MLCCTVARLEFLLERRWVGPVDGGVSKVRGKKINLLSKSKIMQDKFP